MSGLPLTAEDLRQAGWTILIGAVCSVSCGLLGCYLVLRRLSLLGDAISHAVLPGIALAFLLTDRVSGWPIILGAMVLGVLTALLTQGVRQLADVPEDASMGVVFTALFALGVLLISNAAAHVDLDPGCVLYGLLDYAAGDTVDLGPAEIPRALLTMVPVLLLTLAFIVLLWKELKIASFDPELATTLGFSAPLLHYLLMAMVAGATVTAFEAVGAILVVAMLIVPAATAHLLTDRLAWMMVWASVVGVLASVLGYVGAVWLNTSVAGMMAVAAGGLFALAVLLAPRHGLLGKVLHNARLALQIACEDVLGVLYRREEAVARGEQPRAEWPVEEARRAGRGWPRLLAVPLLRWRGEVERQADTIRLTGRGRERAAFLVRSHRLWETYLTEHGVLPLDHLHEPAERMEHFIDPALQEELAADLNRPQRDPHGREIPPER
jgi:ABC-type Mn2+/Zn2+ transport system permease subunit